MNENIFNKKGNNTRSLVVVLGAALVLTGLTLLAFNFGWLNPAFKSVIFSWPMLFILFAVVGFSKRQILLPVLFLLIGVFFLLPRLEIVYPGILGEAGRGGFAKNFWPFLLIIIGLMFIVGVAIKRKKKVSFTQDVVDTQIVTSGESGWITSDVVFGGLESVFLEPILKGGDIDVVFGGMVIDLRKTTLPDTTVYLNGDAIFGGITLYIPEDWCVKSKFNPVFGGYSDKRASIVVDDKSDSRLVLQGSLIFSGCTIQ
ncbi:MAG: LiaF transmembrane domain-containing protein [Bacteroidales bacterium]|jgi:predicted membrane protein|nr:cell wall-active antibiotics response protein [Bacteroidales bacterium]